jgi:hypothetical protein
MVIVDEVGYIPFDPEAANLVFALVSSRCQGRLKSRPVLPVEDYEPDQLRRRDLPLLFWSRWFGVRRW